MALGLYTFGHPKIPIGYFDYTDAHGTYAPNLSVFEAAEQDLIFLTELELAPDVFDYNVQLVTFDGTHDYLSRGAGLGLSDGKQGLISVWIRLAGTPTRNHNVFYGEGSIVSGLVRLRFDPTGLWVTVYTSAGGIVLLLQCTTVFNDTDGLLHVLASWDAATSSAHLYVNDVNEADSVTINNVNAGYSSLTDFFIGGNNAGSGLLAADMGDLYFHTTYLDLSVEANRRLFIDASGGSVYLGADGSTPTGTTPVVFLSGNADTFHTNKGTGGGFTLAADAELEGGYSDVSYLGSEDFIAHPDDAGANRYYMGVVKQPLRLSRIAWNSNRLGGMTTRLVGATEFVNVDGVLDSFLNEDDVDGRNITIKSVVRADPSRLDSATTLFSGTVESKEWSTDTIRLNVAENDALLNKPIQPYTYLGSGGLEGPAALAGRRKPMAFGFCYGVSPVPLGIVNSYYHYHVAAHRIAEVTGAFDRGVALTYVNTDSPVAGEFTYNGNSGTLWVGAIPAGAITCNARGYLTDTGSFLFSTADIIQTMLTNIASLELSRINTVSFGTFNTNQPADVGMWFGTVPIEIDVAIQTMLQGASGLGGFGRDNVYAIQQLRAGDGVVRATFDEMNTIRFERMVGPDVLNPPPWFVSVGYQFNQTPTTDIASGATEAQRSFMPYAFREGTAANSLIALRHKKSVPYFIPGLFANQADAQAEASRILSLVNSTRLWRVVGKNVSPYMDIGQTVTLTNTRFGLNAQSGLILGVKVNFDTHDTELDVLA